MRTALSLSLAATSVHAAHATSPPNGRDRLGVLLRAFLFSRSVAPPGKQLQGCCASALLWPLPCAPSLALARCQMLHRSAQQHFTQPRWRRVLECVWHVLISLLLQKNLEEKGMQRRIRPSLQLVQAVPSLPQKPAAKMWMPIT
jgi:hypothetical protein